VAREARREGWRVVAFLVVDPPPEVAGMADRVVPVRLGDVGPVLAVLAEEGIRHVVLAGKVTKAGLFQGAPLDAAAQELLARSADWTDHGLLSSVARGLAALGVELVDQRRFLGSWLAPAGHLAGPRPDPAAAGAFAPLYRALHRVDVATNWFPSLHVALAWLAVGGYASHGWRARATATTGALAITLSTLTTGQHLLVDVAGGLLTAALARWVAGRLAPAPGSA
jgi:membrane-associated phospholipid phosphatase